MILKLLQEIRQRTTVNKFDLVISEANRVRGGIDNLELMLYDNNINSEGDLDIDLRIKEKIKQSQHIFGEE